MKRAFTLVEVLTCMAIIAVAAAVCFPALTAAMRAAQVSSSVGNLHQQQIALRLYMGEQDPTPTTPGPPSNDPFENREQELRAMGLPDGPFLLGSRLGLPVATWQSPCGQNPYWAPVPVTIQYDYLLDTGVDAPAVAFADYGDDAVVFDDLNCADHDKPLTSDFFPHRGLGVTYAGALLNLYRDGQSMSQAWWH